MRLLVDTHLLLWAAYASRRLPRAAVALMADEDNELLFSAVSIAEVAIKFARGRPDFAVEPHLFRRQLVDNGYAELSLTGAHAAALAGLPEIHGDPFDRLLVAQATVEGTVLLTADARIGEYGGVVRRV